jgi:hypothetical protein
MKSESLFVKCKSCGKDIASSASACPNCGAKQKKLKTIHWVGIIIGILFLIGIFASPNDSQNANTGSSDLPEKKSTQTKNAISKPTEQELFENMITKYIEKYKMAKNELQKSALRADRMEDIRKNLSEMSVDNWVGRINDLSTNSEGKAILSIRITPNIDIKTWNNSLSDFSSNTLIEKDSQLYRQLMDLEKGTYVTFSGSFFSSEYDYIQETSLTEDGSMTSPEFLMKFINVKPIN